MHESCQRNFHSISDAVRSSGLCHAQFRRPFQPGYLGEGSIPLRQVGRPVSRAFVIAVQIGAEMSLSLATSSSVAAHD